SDEFTLAELREVSVNLPGRPENEDWLDVDDELISAAHQQNAVDLQGYDTDANSEDLVGVSEKNTAFQSFTARSPGAFSYEYEKMPNSLESSISRLSGESW